MSSKSSHAARFLARPRGMGYVMSWLRQAAIPTDLEKRQRDEDLAQLGLNQENILRSKLRLPRFEYATIMYAPFPVT